MEDPDTQDQGADENLFIPGEDEDGDEEDITTFEDDLERLGVMVKLLKDFDLRISGMQETLAELTKKRDKIGKEEIPELLHKHGLSELRLKTGEKVVVKEDISVSIPDEKKPAFFEFLENKKAGDLIKLMFQFPRMPIDRQQQLMDFLESYEYDYSVDKGVHPQTMKKFFRELFGVGEEPAVIEAGIKSGKFMRPQDVSAFASCFPYFDTKIKA